MPPDPDDFVEPPGGTGGGGRGEYDDEPPPAAGSGGGIPEAEQPGYWVYDTNDAILADSATLILLRPGRESGPDNDERYNLVTDLGDRIVTHAGDSIVVVQSDQDPSRQVLGRDYFSAGRPWFGRLADNDRPLDPNDRAYLYVERVMVVRVDDPEPRLLLPSIRVGQGAQRLLRVTFVDKSGPSRQRKVALYVDEALRLAVGAYALPGGTGILLDLTVAGDSGSGTLYVEGVAPAVFRRHVRVEVTA